MDNSVPVPIRRKRYLVFDVETTGLMPQVRRQSYYSNNSLKNEDYPYIIQLSFVVYDIHQNKIDYSYDAYIQLPDEIELPEFITNITGITKKLYKKRVNLLKKY